MKGKKLTAAIAAAPKAFNIIDLLDHSMMLKKWQIQGGEIDAFILLREPHFFDPDFYFQKNYGKINFRMTARSPSGFMYSSRQRTCCRASELVVAPANS